jgi:pre-rRNA-processing protein TSR3
MLSAIADCSWLMSHRDLLERYRECKSAQQVKQVQDAILAELEEDAARRKDALMAYGEDLLVTNPNHSVLEDD